MKIGIVGCGLNSDYHINFAKAYPGLSIVGVVDKDPGRARECARRFGIGNIFSSIGELVDFDKPDVLHIVTPPKTHSLLAREAMERKCHVLVEKPLALDLPEAESLYETAEKCGVRLCTMHNHFFDPCMRKAHRLVGDGSLGEVINVESYYGLNTRIPAFRDYPAPNVLPWIYDLPGSVFHDFMPHPLYVLLEYTGKPRDIKVMQQSHGVLPQNLPDELRVLIDGERAFGTLTFSFAARPHLHFIRIYGTRMMVEVDINTMTTVVHPVSSLPKAVQKATYNLDESRQLFTSTVSNVIRFLTGKLKPYQGMKTEIHEFYDAIRNGTESPVTREQALLVIGTMDEIWRQVRVGPLKHDPFIPSAIGSPRRNGKVLVTGGTGFLGTRLVEMLGAEGYSVRVLARKLSNVGKLKELGAEIFWGDVGDRTSLGDAVRGTEVVVHAAAGTSGQPKDCDTGTLTGTRNVLEECAIHGIRKLVYISSCSVYGVADYKEGQTVTEESSIEKYPEKRGPYSASKQQAESHVLEAMKSAPFPIVVLRPGTIYGPGGDIYTPMMGFSVGSKLFVVIGDGTFELPFVYVDNLCGTIIKSIETDASDNQVFNVVDGQRISKREYMNRLIRRMYPRSRVIYFPFFLLNALVGMQEVLCKLLKREPFLTRYRLISSQRKIRYDNSKVASRLKWAPEITFEEALERIIAWRRECG